MAAIDERWHGWRHDNVARVSRRVDPATDLEDVAIGIGRPHVTLCHVELPELVRRLLNCEHTERPNPYRVPEDGG